MPAGNKCGIGAALVSAPAARHLVRHRVGFTGCLFWTGFGFRLFLFGLRLVVFGSKAVKIVLWGACAPKNQSEPFSNQNKSVDVAATHLAAI